MYTKHKLYQRARNSFYDQKKRCYNPKNRNYKWYGEKGITVEYNLVSFLNWYYKNANGYSRPTVDRIDHAKNYDFPNIQIVEKSENSKEMISRCGTPLKKRAVIAYKDGEVYGYYESAYHAAREIGQGVCQSGVRYVSNGIRKKHKGFIFKFKE